MKKIKENENPTGKCSGIMKMASVEIEKYKWLV